MLILYRLFISIYPAIARLLGFYNPKAAAWVNGRKRIFEKLAMSVPDDNRPLVWMHCASLGEFEQGLPVLEAIRKQYPACRILVSFFSSSGYEIRKNHPAADITCYLPMDSPAHARRFCDMIRPSLVLFVKYEFWYYYLTEIRNRKIPLLLISGIFREDQPFFRWYGTLHKEMLACFSGLLLQNDLSESLVKSILPAADKLVSGDTRFDRVLEIADHHSPITLIEEFCAASPVLVAGSTWTDDDEELDHYVHQHPEIRFIIAPHDIGKERIEECRQLYGHAILFSEYADQSQKGLPLPDGIHVLIIDNVGMLSQLYYYADICYVGGGFGDDGIHNILEAAVYGKPVVFGPVYDKYPEADGLIEAGGAFSINDALELESLLDTLFQNTAEREKAGKAARHTVESCGGATRRIMDYIAAKRLLIS
jgi:3-deoxy-D-manno-octulosonic-acid transferase